MEVKRSLEFHWIVVGATFVTLIAVAGIRSTPTMFVLPLEHEFGWSAAQISFAIAINIMLYGLIGPFAAAAMERFGVRSTVVAALLLLAAAAGLSTLIRLPWQLDATWGVMAGFGVGAAGLALGATIASRWFVEHRGLVMGIFAAANATGQLVFLPLFGVIIEHAGWRLCALILSGVCLALIPIFVLFVRDRPVDIGLPRYGERTLTSTPPSVGNPFPRALGGLREGLHSRDFWLLAGSFFICGASTNGLIGTHLVPACGDHGIPEVRAAGLLAAMGVFDLVGTTLSGWLSDRFSSRRLLFWYYGLRGLSLLFLPAAFGLAFFGLPIFAVFYGLDWIATVPPTLKLSADAFGSEKAPMMFSWIAASHQLGASLAAWGGGVVRTSFGSYNDAFLFAGGLCMIASFMVLFIGRTTFITPERP
ncbi:MAG TPA: MFS transporter [Candidatus Baltobacteraceae bacterium]|jgi:MFS family permease|nr:MFS transporter [Candidatus Baltobacteraceae bacterium]